MTAERWQRFNDEDEAALVKEFTENDVHDSIKDLRFMANRAYPKLGAHRKQLIREGVVALRYLLEFYHHVDGDELAKLRAEKAERVKTLRELRQEVADLKEKTELIEQELADEKAGRQLRH